MDLKALTAAKAPSLPSKITDADVKKAHAKFLTAFGKLQTSAKAFKTEFDTGAKAGNDFYSAVEAAAKAAKGDPRTELMKFLNEVLTFKRDNLG